MAQLLKGAPVAEYINERSAKALRDLEERGICPTLAIVRVGQREDDLAYERGAVKRCEKVGVRVRSVVLEEECSQRELEAEIQRLNMDESVHGILVFLPLPAHLDSGRIREAIRPEKDVDGVTSGSLAGVFTGSGVGFAPCTAQACLEILDYYKIDPAGKKACVIGRSLVVGKPAAMLLLGRNSTVTICHTKTQNLEEQAKAADILLVAAGKSGCVDGACMHPGQIVLDVGIHALPEGGLCGDVAPGCEDLCAALTPVPGGVGTVTTSVLVGHVVEAASRLEKRT